MPEKRKKTGGRQKGTPNKATAIGRQTILELLTNYSDSGLMSKDFLALEDPKDRLLIAEKLFQYVMPKMQSTAIDLSAAAGVPEHIDNALAALSEEAGD